MQVQALSTIQHDGHDFSKGQVLDVSEAQAKELIDAGAASAEIDDRAIPQTTPPDDASVEEKAEGGKSYNPDDLEAKTRKELNELASEAGVEDAASLENKAAVIKAIEDASAETEE